MKRTGAGLAGAALGLAAGLVVALVLSAGAELFGMTWAGWEVIVAMLIGAGVGWVRGSTGEWPGQ